MQRLLAFAALFQLALGATKYSCVFDCYLFKDKGSARGYLEYACDPAVETDCCTYTKCIAQANSLYGGLICPGAISDEPDHAEGFAQYHVGLAETVADQYPRNKFFLYSDNTSTAYTHAACPTPSCGCFGTGCSSGACQTVGTHTLGN